MATFLGCLRHTTFSVKSLFNFQSDLLLIQLHSISPCPITGNQREEIRTSLWGSCRLWWGYPSAISSPSWTRQETSAALLKTYPLELPMAMAGGLGLDEPWGLFKTILKRSFYDSMTFHHLCHLPPDTLLLECVIPLATVLLESVALLIFWCPKLHRGE